MKERIYTSNWKSKQRLMKGNKSCKGENKSAKYPPALYSNCRQQKLEILHSMATLNILEVSDNYTYTPDSEAMTNSRPGEYACPRIRTGPERRERVVREEV